ncbi:putative cell division protein [Leptospirillum ferrooxidans C2-3]|uniref:Signal recognition particle receptor FtsY n=2 Tax=Leptospirillum ferrooxidans TaxID=180 RepID=I0IPW4_LEPFC|nr:putative cell division protein [Leptospirillum ferrooxidans C2-3]
MRFEMNLFQKFTDGLKKTRANLTEKIDSLFKKDRSSNFHQELETILLTSDMGPKVVSSLITDLKEWEKSPGTDQFPDARSFMIDRIEKLFPDTTPIWENPERSSPLVILVVGVNGAGKTTTVAKLAALFKSEGKSVILGAGDTFRAAAIKQLELWGEKLSIPVVHQKEGADPASVAFDTVKAAISRKIDVAIIDTAGRLQTKNNLMSELSKIHRLVIREVGNNPIETLIVLDATIGQNAVSQVKHFGESVPLTGMILSKMDGTSKGGIAVGLAKEFSLPVRFIGVGEQSSDLLPFDPSLFARSILQTDS